jgi:hypothetical protein
MIIDKALEFSDAQSIVLTYSASTAITVESTTVVNLGTGRTDGWGTTINPDIGGLVWNTRVNTIMVGVGGIITAELVTKADASLSSGATVVASVVFPAASAAGTKAKVTLPRGTTALQYLGVNYTNSAAAVTGSKFDSFLSLDNE